MRTELDFKSAQICKSKAKPMTGPKFKDLKSSPVRIVGFEMTSHTNKSLLKVRLISFDPVQRLNEDSGKIIEPRREPN